MTKTVLLFYADIIDAVKRSLDIIGKRAVDDKGNTLFETITVSTRETPILQDYAKTAIVAIVTELRKFVQAAYKGIRHNSLFQIYDFDGFLNVAVPIENVGAATGSAQKNIYFSNVLKMFIMQIVQDGLVTRQKYYDSWENGYPYNEGKTSPSESVLFRYDNKLYRWNGTDLETFDEEAATLEGIGITLNLADDYNEDLDITMKQALQDYCVAYSLYSWFTVTSPRLAEKYLNDAVAHRSYFISSIFHRKDLSDLPNPLRQLAEP